MPMHTILRSTLPILLGLALSPLVFSGHTASSAPPPPAPPAVTPPTPPPYAAPDLRQVLAGQAPVRVLIFARQAMFAWKSDGKLRVVSLEDGKELCTATPDQLTGLVRVPETGAYALRRDGQNFCPVPAAGIRVMGEKPLKLWTPTPDSWTAQPPRCVLLPAADGTFHAAQEWLLDDYLKQVVPSEMPATFHAQALRAQAVISRTYTLCKLGRHCAEGADLCASVHCQVCGPASKRTKETDAAVDETRGLVLLSNGKLVETYYHSTCGGVTDDASYIWGPQYTRPYLGGIADLARKNPPAAMTIAQVLASDDAYCKGSPSARWTKTFTAAEVDALVSRNLSKVTGDPTAHIRKVTNMAVEQRSPFGRVATLRVEGDGASVVVYGDAVRWLFGTGEPGADGLWSALFDLTVTRDAAGAITGYTMRGAGRGHGIGLCQWGAEGRAKAGQSYRDILQAYYPGAQATKELK